MLASLIDASTLNSTAPRKSRHGQRRRSPDHEDLQELEEQKPLFRRQEMFIQKQEQAAARSGSLDMISTVGIH
jgi:hypothetical protein